MDNIVVSNVAPEKDKNELSFAQKRIKTVESFETDYINAVNPIYFNDDTIPITPPLIVVPANNSELQSQEKINEFYNLNINENNAKYYQTLEPVHLSSSVDQATMRFNNLIEFEQDVENITDVNYSSYHSSSHSSMSFDYASPFGVSEDKYNENQNEKINTLNIFRSIYINGTSSDYDEYTQDSIDNTPTYLSSKIKVNRIQNRAIQTQKRLAGEEYVNVSNKVLKKKMPKPVNCEKCKFKCAVHFTEEMRIEICRQYWDLADFIRQKSYLTSSIVESSVKRNRPKTYKTSKRKPRTTFEYNLTDLNGNKHRVCQKYFCSTLHITCSVIKLALENCNEARMFVGFDKRIGRAPRNQTSNTLILEVKNHIQSFPTMESHYCRRDTKKLYLSSDLKLSIMYRLYCNITPEPVSKCVYARVLYEFNPALTFYKPKTDQCTICNNYNDCLKSSNLTDQIKIDWIEHKRREKESFDMKNDDKKIATDNLGKSFRSISFDLQAGLNLPHAGDSQIYYKRKLSVFNFTIYEHHSSKGFCYVWDESNGGEGSAEIGTCLLQYLQNLPETVQHVVTYSDTRGGQNRNKNTMTAIMYAVQTIDNIQTIDIKFMESGHSYLEADSIQATIQRTKRHKQIYTTQEWSLLIQKARMKPQPYIVKTNTFYDFYDFKKMGLETNYWNRNIEGMVEKIKWFQIKWMRFEKSKPFIVQFKYNLSDDKFMKLNVAPFINNNNLKNSRPILKKIQKYKAQIPVSQAKKSDLLSLLENGVIPKKYDSFYNNISTTTKQNNTNYFMTDDEEAC